MTLCPLFSNSMVRRDIKTLQVAENLEYDDDEEILAILDGWTD